VCLSIYNIYIYISLHLSMYRTQSSKCCCVHCRLRLPKEICVHLQSAYQNIIQPRTNHYWSSPFHSIKWFVYRYVYIYITYIYILYILYDTVHISVLYTVPTCTHCSSHLCPSTDAATTDAPSQGLLGGVSARHAPLLPPEGVEEDQCLGESVDWFQ
jgi:hypothetical protein